MNFKLLSLIALILINFSCKKDNNNTSNSISSPFDVKYEIIASSKVTASFNYPMITYVNNTGQLQTESITSVLPGSPWVKSVSVTTTSRPLQLSLLLSANNPAYYLVLQNSGSVVQNLYVNGSLVASSTNQSETIPTGNNNTYKINILPLDYVVN